MVNLDFQTNLAPYEGSAGSLGNTVACTDAVQTAGYNFDLSSGGYIAGNPAVVSGGTDPTDLMTGPLDIINQTGGKMSKKKKKKKSRRLKRSNRSRLNSRSKKSKSRSKVKKVRKSLSKHSIKKKRKSKSRRRSLR